ncbi:MAG TPA: hypothetical protein VMR86_18340 [Myxococcota bacterium]|nr:hypothetical protein [Myxococcota bacterium]
MRTILTISCALALGTVACFPVPVPVPEHHHDPNVVIYDHDPGGGRDCWRHEDHWDCRR